MKPDSNRIPIGRRRSSRGVGLAWLVAGFLAIAAVPCAHATAATCDGKQATIASNAAKIVGTKAPDVIAAGSGDNTIYGLGGNDVICAGGGDDTIYGERGDDTVDGEGGSNTVYGGRGSDNLDGGSGADRVFGETGNDTLTGGPGDGDYVDAGPGDDTVSGGPGDFDVVVGGVGNDRIDGGPGAGDIASYKGTGGAVTINLEAGAVTGAENEQLTGIEGAIGGSGDDTLIGSTATPDQLDGGPGNDHLVAAGSGDEAFGGPGSDVCSGFSTETSCGSTQGVAGTAVELYKSIDGSTSLIVTGNEGADAVDVSYADGAYTIRAEPGGNEVLLGDPESDSCAHSPASSSVSCHGSVSSILASLGGGDDTFLIDESVPADVSSIVDGGKGSDTLQGGRGNDTIYAGDDHDPDTIEGGGGDDVLYGVDIFHPQRDSGPATMLGGPGDDLLIGGQPCDGDLFDGGAGDNDSASFARVRNSGIFVQATIGGSVLDPDIAQCDAGHIEHSVEKIEGSPGPDILVGDETPNTLLGRGGDDNLDGMGGSDDCIGGGGNNETANCEFTAP
ncbi:MAG TPA: calcium-binding protein [Solirubrobacterales bacterium]